MWRNEEEVWRNEDKVLWRLGREGMFPPAPSPHSSDLPSPLLLVSYQLAAENKEDKELAAVVKSEVNMLQKTKDELAKAQET